MSDSAFPHEISNSGGTNHYGLTKREYFAALLLSSTVSSNDYYSNYEIGPRVRQAVKLADALLKELES